MLERLFDSSDPQDVLCNVILRLFNINSMWFGTSLIPQPGHFIYIQLFRQRLSCNSTKAYTTMPIGINIIGSNSLALLGWGSQCLARMKENAWIHLFVLLPSLTPRYLGLQLIKCKTIVTHNNFCHCGVHFHAFVRPFSKQLYVSVLWRTWYMLHDNARQCQFSFFHSFSFILL